MAWEPRYRDRTNPLGLPPEELRDWRTKFKRMFYKMPKHIVKFNVHPAGVTYALSLGSVMPIEKLKLEQQISLQLLSTRNTVLKGITYI